MAEATQDLYHPTEKRVLPVIPLKDVVIFPGVAAPLAVRRARSVRALDAAIAKDKLVLFVPQKNAAAGDPKPEDLYEIGTIAKVRESARQKGTVRLVVEGVVRARVRQVLATDPFIKAEAEVMPTPKFTKTDQVEAESVSLMNRFRECVNMGANVPFDVLLVVMNVSDPWQLADLVAVNLDFSVEERYAVLSARTVEDKLARAREGLARQMKVLRMARDLQAETGKEIDKMQKEMFLREQMKTIEKELGQMNGAGASEAEELRKKIEAAGMPDEVKAKALKELARMQAMPSFSPELSYIRGYLDWLIAMPWSVRDKDEISLRKAKKVLDEDHFGLAKVKERILDFLAVQKLAGKTRGSILCFVGPPGTGKTSIGKSIARAMGRKFFRMSLGGLRDEAEIRGHRRTYVGALPGRILQGIAQAKTRNPVFMLDEIDKVGTDFRGDPTAALLEALDPEQNNSFGDHYLEVPFDLSDVFFITTANILDTVPPALRDRMEVIEYPGYTEDEKVRIAVDYLVPKAQKEHGLASTKVKIAEKAVRRVVREYTREAGVRNLERNVMQVFRKIARKVAENGGTKAWTIGERDVPDYLGVPKFRQQLAEKKDAVGVVTGLAWTEAGGEILPIEATRMPGKGQLILTGQLGKVMQESAQAAHSYARANAKRLGIKGDFNKDEDLHVHVPQGAIPKDGPSAGVAMTAAIVSLLTGKPVRRSVAVTGEVTLRGHVLEIGGVKEKVLGAHRAGIRTVVLPKDNEKDLEEIPANVRKAMRFVPVETVDEAIAALFARR
ncbi:MAG TPA: endopeptidase La [Patescibacteria group bacterium]|nr:endopeptidase La [Patescibacteria group bacterium]